MSQGDAWLPLSSPRLQVQQANLELMQNDDVFVANQTRHETEQDYERALYNYVGPEFVYQQDSTELLRTIVHRNGLKVFSSATPMRRFCFVAKTNESIPLAAQQAGSSGFEVASFESIEMRSDAAGIAAEELETVRDAQGHPVTGERNGPRGRLVRVQKLQRRRTQESKTMVAISVTNHDEQER